jgi:sulfatase modifying factor 1
MMLKQLLFCGFSALISLTATAQPDEKTIAKQRKQFLKNGFHTYIPAGKLTKVISDNSSDSAVKTTTVSVNAFYMKTSEVSNIDYLEFLAYYKTRDEKKYSANLLDTTVWRTAGAFMEPMVTHYFRHPAYYLYPVVGVTHTQAKAYCAWLTEIVNANPDRAFKKVIYRLPTEAEWVYAANGGIDGAIFPWKGNHLLNEDGESKANCLAFTPENIFRDTLYERNEKGEFEPVPLYRTKPGGFQGERGSLQDAADLTAITHSYYPNGFGLYNMAGNVAEMVAEPGITHGGSWYDPAYYLQNQIRQYYTDENKGSSQIGFRYVMEVVEY